MKEFLSIGFGSTVLKAVISVFSRIGVPLFLMISGVLLLNKKMEDGQDVKRFYRHNLLSLFLTAEIWYFLMYWVIVLFQPTNQILETEGFGGAVLQMLKTMLFVDQVTMGSMWYMPMILCLYTTIPFAAMLKDKLSPRSMALPMALVFLYVMVLPAINTFCAFQGEPKLSTIVREANLCSMYYLYVFTGFLIGRGVLAGWRDWTVAAVGALTFAACCAYQIYAYAQPDNYLVSYSSPGILLCAACLFEFIRRKAHWLKSLRPSITYMSKISLGIYFVHIVIMSLLVWYMDFDGWRRSAQMFFLEGVSFVGSILLIALLFQIKVCRKYLFLIKN